MPRFQFTGHCQYLPGHGHYEGTAFRPCAATLSGGSSQNHFFISQVIANTLWALATMNVQHPDLVQQLCQEAAVKCHDFISPGIGNTH